MQSLETFGRTNVIPFAEMNPSSHLVVGNGLAQPGNDRESFNSCSIKEGGMIKSDAGIQQGRAIYFSRTRFSTREKSPFSRHLGLGVR